MRPEFYYHRRDPRSAETVPSSPALVAAGEAFFGNPDKFNNEGKKGGLVEDEMVIKAVAYLKEKAPDLWYFWDTFINMKTGKDDIDPTKEQNLVYALIYGMPDAQMRTSSYKDSLVFKVFFSFCNFQK
jgi:hypothetical protein